MRPSCMSRRISPAIYTDVDTNESDALDHKFKYLHKRNGQSGTTGTAIIRFAAGESKPDES